MDIIAIVNDTVGTMITCSFDHQLCCVGLIVGNYFLFLISNYS